MAYEAYVGDFDQMEDEWASFLPFSATNTVFVTPWWQRIWWRNFGDGWDLHITAIREGGVTAGIAPLMSKGGEIRLVGDPDIVDYLDFLVCQEKAEEFFAALWDHLEPMEWGRLELTGVPQDSPTLAVFARIAGEKGCAVEIEREDTTPLASLPVTWDDYLAGLSKKNRHELRRKLRRLDGAGESQQYVRTDPSTLPEDMDDFFRLLRASRPDKDEFLTPERQKFFEDTALELVSRNQFRLNFLEVDGTRVACCICFDYDGSYLLYNSGYDPSYASLSVGLLNKALCLKDAIEEGKQTFDFLRGSERYKYDLGGQDHLVYRVTLTR